MKALAARRPSTAGSRNALPLAVRAPLLISTFSRSRDRLGSAAASARSSRQPAWLGAERHLDGCMPPGHGDRYGRGRRGFQAGLRSHPSIGQPTAHERRRSCQPALLALVPRPAVAGRCAQQRHRAARRRAGPGDARALPRTARGERAGLGQQVEILPPRVRRRRRVRRRHRHARGPRPRSKACSAPNGGSSSAGWSATTNCQRARSSCC